MIRATRFRMRPSLTLVVCVLTVLASCKTESGRLKPDAGVDAGRDAALADGEVVDGEVVDAEIVDGSIDAELDAAPDFGDGGPRVPVCSDGTACGPGDSCADGAVCVTNACNVNVCQPRGAFCADDTGCAGGSECTDTDTGALCVPTNGEVCNASSDCPVAFSCEGASGSRACVPRRIPCFDEAECPVSYFCAGVVGDSQLCQYVYRPCDASGCALGICGDVDGDGDDECGGAPSCEDNTTCSTPGDRCEVRAGVVVCASGGLCDLTGDICALGYECRDLHGDGYGECVPIAGTCTTQSDCPPGQVCAVAQDHSPPHCTSPL
jgi:hypothetical protein